MKTIKQYIEFYEDDKNVLIGIKQKNGIDCNKKHYVTPQKALIKYSGWLDKKVVKCFPFNLVKDNKQYCLLIYN